MAVNYNLKINKGYANEQINAIYPKMGKRVPYFDPVFFAR